MPAHSPNGRDLDFLRYANTCYGGVDYPTVIVSLDMTERTSVLLQTSSNRLWQ